MANSWLDAMNAPSLGIVIAGNHYAATQTMDEEHRQEIRFHGGFGHDGPIARSVRQADESTVSFSAILLEPGQNAGMDDETWMLGLKSFRIACRRGMTGAASDWHYYEGCAWSAVRVNSTLDQVTLNADFSVPGYAPPERQN
jgi:hypothetical protein